MKAKLGRRLERWMTLIYQVPTDTWKVETRKPFGRRWVTRIYKPTAASLERVKRVVGHKHGMNGWSIIGGRYATKEYWICR